MNHNTETHHMVDDSVDVEFEYEKKLAALSPEDRVIRDIVNYGTDQALKIYNQYSEAGDHARAQAAFRKVLNVFKTI